MRREGAAPWHWLTPDQAGERERRGGAVRHAPLVEAGRSQHPVGAVPGRADVRQQIGRPVVLCGPPMGDLGYREVLESPSGEPLLPRQGRRTLPYLVTLAADDEIPGPVGAQ